MKRALALSLAIFLLAGCGGGGGGGSTVPGTQTVPPKNALGSVVISIPTSAATATKVRYPQFVSPNAQSVALSINGGADTIFDVSANSSLCVTAAGVRNCTLAFSAPAGSDTFAFLIFAGPNASGAQLASATTTHAIVAAQAFSFLVAMNAAIGTVVGNVGSTNQNNCPNGPFNNNSNVIDEGCPGSGILTIAVTDPSGAVVSGPAAYASSFVITANDPSLSASPATITTPGQTSTLSYTGAAFAGAISTQVTFTLTVAGVAIPVPVPVRRSYLYVANSNAPFGTAPGGGGSVAVYTYGANLAASPIRTIAGTNTGLLSPLKPLVDANGSIYVLDDGIPVSVVFNPTIRVFAPGAGGNVTPVRVISNMGALTTQACSDMVFDPTGAFLFVACGTEIQVFPITANGPATSVVATQMQDDSLNTQSGLAFDPAGNLYISDSIGNVIDIATGPIPTSGGFHNFVGNHTLSTPTGWSGSVIPDFLAIDNQGTLYAPVYFSNASSGPSDALAQLGIWHSNVLPCTNCPPSAFLTGAPFATHAVIGVTLDPIGDVYVANAFTSQITEFSAATIAGASLGTTGAVLRTLNNTGSGQATTPLGMTVGP